jgi:putative ABC transport system permease protein
MIRSLLFGVAPADPSTYAFTIAVLAIAAVCACTLPAAKAIRVDPVVSLREQ